MKQIDELINRLSSEHSCEIAPPCGLPRVASGLILPADVVQFYERAGGMIINKQGRCGSWARIVRPDEFNRIDAVILGGEMFATGPFEFWHAMVDVQDSNYLAIDIGPTHRGICLDCFHETFAMPGYVKLVATSFTDLLNRFVNHMEDSAFWLQDDFEALGEGFELYGYKVIA